MKITENGAARILLKRLQQCATKIEKNSTLRANSRLLSQNLAISSHGTAINKAYITSTLARLT